MSGPWIAAFVCLTVLVMLLALMVLGVMRRMVGVLERAERMLANELDGISLLSAVPTFEVIDRAGQIVSSQQILKETSLLLFLESGCAPCRAIASDLAESNGLIGSLPLIVVAGEEGLDDDFKLSPKIAVVRQRNREVARLFKSVATPHAFVVDEDGVVLDRVIPGARRDLERMAERQAAGMRRLEGVG
jgi:thiol-disulfide isomerase/thioredoxin